MLNWGNSEEGQLVRWVQIPHLNEIKNKEYVFQIIVYLFSSFHLH